MSRCLVIGGNGFIGSHLVDALARAGHAVAAFDRFSAGPRFVDRSVIRMTGDFLNRADLVSAVRNQDFVFHFLSLTSPATAESDPTLDIRTNTIQSVELFDICASAGVRRLYFASTGGAIYGDSGGGTKTERDPTLPVSPYAIGKLSIENYLRYFRATRKLVSTVFRISNPYGPRQPANRKQGLIPIALRRILRGESVVRFGDGSMVRDYLYVEDLVSNIVATVGTEPRHSTYNMGSGKGHSINEVLGVIQHVVRRPIRIVETRTPDTYVSRVVLDTTRFTSEFGDAPLMSLEAGIRRTWESIQHEED